jgi:predicted RNase H-like nuclease (RuvC/YqgF family)
MEEQQQTAEAEMPVSESDALKLENEKLQGELKSRSDAITKLEKTLAERDAAITAMQQSLEANQQQLDAINKALPQAVSAYKALVIQANPGTVAGMVQGDTIIAIDESVKSARALVARVKQEVGAENARVKVPAGAPPRALPDFSGLSSREKIKFAMEGKS